MNNGSYSASELRTQQVSIKSDSQSYGQNFFCIATYDTFQRLKKIPRRRIKAHYEQLSCRIIGLEEASWANKRDDSHMGRSDAAIRRYWATADREARLMVRSAVTTPDSSLSTIRRANRTLVSTMTIPKRLVERNLRSYRPLRHLRTIQPDYNGVWLDQVGIMLTGDV
ncbi:HTH_Tnp_Tc3_2 domain-containing protein [Trichonephila clavipes]|nr:HTH_Tnp_Tc3_2 domain-containing protein [Trichonephila clavipes]